VCCAARRPAHPGDAARRPPQEVCAELLSVLDAYPGGLTLAVIATQLQLSQASSACGS
jgi:hypothetical protein